MDSRYVLAIKREIVVKLEDLFSDYGVNYKSAENREFIDKKASEIAEKIIFERGMR